MRTVKDPDSRRAEILDTAQRLFTAKGYTETTIVDILGAIGIAKGTFYHYFKSKEEVLDAIIERVVEADVAAAEEIVNNADSSVFDKLLRVFLEQRPRKGEEKARIMSGLHHPSNAEMHQKSLVRSIAEMTPVVTRIVEQGIREGSMKTEFPRETVELLLAAGQTLFDEGLFHWPREEADRKARAFIRMMELSLGARAGDFHFMSEILTGKADQL